MTVTIDHFLSRYVGYERWKKTRWAWEFLIRNKDFIKSCEAVKDGDEAGKKAVAAEFGLTRFKPYDEAYDVNLRPAFKANRVRSKPNLDGRSTARRVKVFPGELAVIFNMTAAAALPKSMASQLRAATKLIERHRAALSAASEKDTRENTKNFVEILVFCDARSEGLNSSEIHRLINPELDNEVLKFESSKWADRLRERAKLYTTHRYLDVITWDPKAFAPKSPASRKKTAVRTE